MNESNFISYQSGEGGMNIILQGNKLDNFSEIFMLIKIDGISKISKSSQFILTLYYIICYMKKMKNDI